MNRLTNDTDRIIKYKKRKKKQKYLLLFLSLLALALLLAGYFLRREDTASESGQNVSVGESGQEMPMAEQNQESARETPPAQAQASLQVHFLDVGQGDATLITMGEHAMLIDAGNNYKGTAVQLYLKKQGVTRLDYIIGTHPDADHIGGLDVMITKFDCGMVMMPEVGRDNKTYLEVIDAMEYRGYHNTPPVVGNRYQLGEASFTIVSPSQSYGDAYNNYSVGVLLAFGNTRFLFVGDAEAAAEMDMLATGISLKADVLKVVIPAVLLFLDAVQPEHAVISCGADNDYGHPHASTLNKLRERKVSVYRTDEQGSIVITSDGENLTTNCSPSLSWKSGWD